MVFEYSVPFINWIHKNGVLNLFALLNHAIIVSVIHGLSLSLRFFDPNENVSTTVALFWFSKECLMQLTFPKRVLKICVHAIKLSPTRNFEKSFNLIRILHVKHTIRTWSDEFF